MTKSSLFFPLLFTFFLASCSTDSPSTVATKFTNALLAGRIEKAKEYANDNVDKQLDFMELNNELIEKMKKVEEELKIANEKVFNDVAEVSFSNGQKLQLRKVDGKWMVHRLIP